MSLVKLNSTESGWSRKNYWSSYGHTCFLQPSRTAFLMFPSPVLCLWPDVVHFKTVCGVTTDANYGKHVLNLGVLYIPVRTFFFYIDQLFLNDVAVHLIVQCRGFEVHLGWISCFLFAEDFSTEEALWILQLYFYIPGHKCVYFASWH